MMPLMVDMLVLQRRARKFYKPASIGLAYGRMFTTLLKNATGVNTLAISLDAMRFLRKAF